MPISNAEQAYELAETGTMDDGQTEAQQSLLPPGPSSSRPYDDLLDPTERSRVPALTVGTIFIVLTVIMLFLNRAVFDPEALDYPYPFLMSSLASLFALAILACIGRVTRLLEGLPALQLGWSHFVQLSAPIGIFHALGIALASIAFAHIAPATVQMLTAFVPLLVLVLTSNLGLRNISRPTIILVIATCGFVGLANLQRGGPFNIWAMFALVGFVLSSAGKLVAVEQCLSVVYNPVIAMYVALPSTLVATLFFVPLLEGRAAFAAFWSHIGLFVLIPYVTLAALHIVSLFFMVAWTSALSTALCALAVEMIVMLFGGLSGAQSSGIRILGYFGASFGLAAYLASRGKVEELRDVVLRKRDSR
ncbi:uncharacterized protein L969DRAFT_91308 [Mixia osmundae IAM 14324]|uniref:Sugar phosphate transporter domain-containing protein n=1 Tax=Mixia osmundae (strain CBS 9802 / IAM 14324 / JCM 22182 / KY 12970) TaxID=764103 RepID=G7DST5_MIXOS|nr:uncharacterized protein L969DRAFT_91308 [Mixia osmundae IAM 14324]KEI41827.1 hypothetical protein L969DRAFT_91308 [Mixia osmundae IAM 14324]GAA93643.1 hypothetical protein E5Q_00287 [Mixia osmundae IAM 14324]